MMNITLRTVVVGLIVANGATTVRAAEPVMPDFRTLAAVVSKQLAKQPGYQPGDLITRREIAGALEALEQRSAWKLTTAQKDELVAKGLEPQSFLAQQLTSKNGREFSRHIAKYQLGYDQLERLSKMPQGRSTVERLVKGPEGWKLLEYMATAKGGHELNKMLSETPRGGNFERSTGRIYDEPQFLAELQKLHQAAVRGSVVAGKSR